MRKVKGRILVYETGAPIANVVVGAFDIDPAAEPSLVSNRSTDRLGSAVTNASGEFSIYWYIFPRT